MSGREQGPGYQPDEGEPRHPLELPRQLKEWLRETPIACLMQETDAGTVHIVKAPAREIQSLRGTIPIGVDYELYAHPLAPVIRTVIRFYDQPRHPFVVETFSNVEDRQQRAEFAKLAIQDELYMLFYDE